MHCRMVQALRRLRHAPAEILSQGKARHVTCPRGTRVKAPPWDGPGFPDGRRAQEASPDPFSTTVRGVSSVFTRVPFQ